MEFGYSKEQVLLRDLYKKFAETEVKPLAEELDEEERFPVETVKKLARYASWAFLSPRNTACRRQLPDIFHGSRRTG